jgi:nucleotide-binding universal stress UspA family protein
MSDRQKEDAYYEHLTRKLGLPTIPDRYKEEGLALAATADSQAEAQVVTEILQEAGVPSWSILPARIRGRWGPNLGADPSSYAILVPADQLAAAQAAIEKAEPELEGLRRELSDDNDAPVKEPDKPEGLP